MVEEIKIEVYIRNEEVIIFQAKSETRILTKFRQFYKHFNIRPVYCAASEKI